MSVSRYKISDFLVLAVILVLVESAFSSLLLPHTPAVSIYQLYIQATTYLETMAYIRFNIKQKKDKIFGYL